MMRWVLLLRAVNLGRTNKVPMADLKRLLEGVGHANVRTYLNSGNATFESSRSAATALATEVEELLAEHLGVTVRALVRRTAEIAAAVVAVPDDLEGYVLVCALFDVPDPAKVKELTTWEPETVRAGEGVLYLAYDTVRGSKLTPALIEKRLGVATTSRTPATLRKLL